MSQASLFVVVLVTAPDLKIARGIVKAALMAKLIACANLIPKVESHYWWRGKMESSVEILMVLKTTKRRLSALEKLVVKIHPYDSPEFVALPLTSGNKRYLDWITRSTG